MRYDYSMGIHGDSDVVNRPFGEFRSAGRMLFDAGIVCSLVVDRNDNKNCLEIGSGSGWLSEFLVRMGFHTYSLDIAKGIIDCVSLRKQVDQRLYNKPWIALQGDAHNLDFKDKYFLNICIYDAFHHFYNYEKVLKEIYRVLDFGGRAIFVEPGLRHSSSIETVNFLRENLPEDPSLIERSLDLEILFKISKSVGFGNAILIPVPHPNNFFTSKFSDSSKFLNEQSEITSYINYIKDINLNERSIFFLEKT